MFENARYITKGVDADTEEDYVAELKSMAGGFGYTSEEIDGMLQSGYSPEEIEDRFYCDSYPLR